MKLNVDQKNSQKYALAFFRLEPSKEKLLEKASLLMDISNLLTSQKTLRYFLLSPLIDRKRKKDLLNRVFKGKLEPKLLQFLKFLVDKRRFQLIPLIAEKYKKLAFEANGILEVSIETPEALEEDSRLSLKTNLESATHKAIRFQETLKPQMIGGIKLSFDNKTLNYALKDRLNKLKKLTLVKQ